MATGKVIGGHYLNAFVSPIIGSTLVVQAPFKPRKLTSDNVATWAEVPTDSKGNPLSAVGQAVAAAAIPGRFGKAASAAVGATFDALGPSHIVRVDWVDGKQSLIKLPDSLYKHFAVMLSARHVPDPEPAVTQEPAPQPAAPTVTDKAFDLVSGIVKDRWPSKSAPLAGTETAAAPQVDITEQLTKLASLRDAGVLTDEEFTTKKAELLARL
ncbi:SHOCT domain-containing protein [Microbacterium sp. M3]|uniref:SHOCT domain-containing protein n=1 Tax=Microbacterium arthrosphaerae TaxID=792652 RepID=A0ABU4GZS6_9MICO|nr:MULTISPECIES: SHOCT domain-containing protein [Microbacterium]MDW4572591.1 SHOCT domain-containing protein [Microbacterium arthrosphaerae]MDW7606446.1 SHOCT domain-containing protein [Microbacterium sp. M3]